jgi:hypothetical protein
MRPPSKKRKTTATEEISFDPSAREEYLTGFHKRKLARIKHAQEENAKKEREERIRARAEVCGSPVSGADACSMRGGVVTDARIVKEGDACETYANRTQRSGSSAKKTSNTTSAK